jgi:hypothetical protein
VNNWFPLLLPFLEERKNNRINKYINMNLLLILTILETMSISAGAWTAEWVDLGTPSISPPRSGHVAFVNHKDDKENNVYVFGGYAEEEGEEGAAAPNRYPTNDLWKWEEEDGWKLVVSNQNENDSSSSKKKNNNPQQRLAAAAASLPNGSSYVFGGWDSQEAGTGGVILKDICEFDGDDAGKMLENVDLGLATSRLVAVTISDDTILLHNHRSTDHVLLFVDGNKVVRQPTTGTAPSPRGLHAALCMMMGQKQQKQLIVFGGAAQDGTMSNEVFRLDLSTWEWSAVDIKSDEAPSPRASPCMCALDDASCVLFGGADVSDAGLHGCDDLWLLQLLDDDGEDDDGTTTATWERLSASGPPGRNAATLTKLASPPASLVKEGDAGKDHQYFLLSGGWYPFRTTHADNFVLKMTKE